MGNHQIGRVIKNFASAEGLPESLVARIQEHLHHDREFKASVKKAVSEEDLLLCLEPHLRREVLQHIYERLIGTNVLVKTLTKHLGSLQSSSSFIDKLCQQAKSLKIVQGGRELIGGSIPRGLIVVRRGSLLVRS